VDFRKRGSGSDLKAALEKAILEAEKNAKRLIDQKKDTCHKAKDRHGSQCKPVDEDGPITWVRAFVVVKSRSEGTYNGTAWAFSQRAFPCTLVSPYPEFGKGTPTPPAPDPGGGTPTPPDPGGGTPTEPGDRPPRYFT
jgi:hypothetical protein